MEQGRVAVCHALGIEFKQCVASVPLIGVYSMPEIAMAGLTEFRGQGQDSFWSWRDLMYRFAARLEPEHMQAIAQWLYIQMLKAGYTSVCEFHYLHHQRDGQNYAPIGLLAQGVMEAASASGLSGQCSATFAYAASAMEAIFLHSVMPPAWDTSGWMMSA